MTIRHGRAVAALGLAAAVMAIGWLALCPRPIPIPVTDDGQHFAAFAVLGLLCRGVQPRGPTLLIAGGLLVAGGAIETLQWAFTTTRHAEWRDMASDAAGVAAALGMTLMLTILHRRPQAACRASDTARS